MPTYTFATHDGDQATVTDAMELEGPEAVREAVLACLPDMARDTIPDGDRRRLSVVAKDGDGHVIYSASLALEGCWGAAREIDGLA